MNNWKYIRYNFCEIFVMSYNWDSNTLKHRYDWEWQYLHLYLSF